jgi:hypothetical protein
MPDSMPTYETGCGAFALPMSAASDADQYAELPIATPMKLRHINIAFRNFISFEIGTATSVRMD